MEENMDMEMELRPERGARRLILWIVGGLVALIVLGYLGLCIYVGASDKILPGIYAADVELASMDQQQAQQAIEEWHAQQYDQKIYVLRCGETTVEVPGTVTAVDSEAVAQAAYQVGRKEPFLKRGAVILSHLMQGWNAVDCQVQLTAEGEQQVELALQVLSEAEDVALVETVWSVEDDRLTIVRGTSGMYVDKEQSRKKLLEAMQYPGIQDVEAVMIEQQPAPLDLQQLHTQLYKQAADAYVERGEDKNVRIVPHVVGVDFDPVQAQAQFDALKAGGKVTISLTLTTPDVTQAQLEEKLFATVIGECTTNTSGTAQRLNNVRVAAKALDGLILMPGEVFSYNEALGPRTTARGYQAAPAYVAGRTVDEVGGGICQNSSTLYLAVLRANLEIVERTNHMFTVGYVPDGLDATVAYNSLDFKFRNNTDYPIRIESRLSGRNTIIKLHGTAVTKHTVKMETKTLSTTDYKVTYKPDDSVAPGKTEVETTAYTGKKIQVFRCVYDEQGKLLSRTQESMNNYRHRDKVILYNPADAEQLGLVDANGVVHNTVQPKKTEPVTPEPVVPEPEVVQPEAEQTEVQSAQPVEQEVPVQQTEQTEVQPAQPMEQEVPVQQTEQTEGV